MSCEAKIPRKIVIELNVLLVVIKLFVRRVSLLVKPMWLLKAFTVGRRSMLQRPTHEEPSQERVEQWNTFSPRRGLSCLVWTGRRDSSLNLSSTPAHVYLNHHISHRRKLSETSNKVARYFFLFSGFTNGSANRRPTPRSHQIRRRPTSDT